MSVRYILFYIIVKCIVDAIMDMKYIEIYSYTRMFIEIQELILDTVMMIVLKQFLLVNQPMVKRLIVVANCWFPVIPACNVPSIWSTNNFPKRVNHQQ